MDGLPIGLIISIIVFVIFGLMSLGEKSQAKTLAKQMGEFKLTVRQALTRLGDGPEDTPIFKVGFSGPVQTYRSNTPMRIVLHVYDITNGQPEPVLSMVDSWQAQGTVVFEFATAEQILPDTAIYSMSNEDLFELPIEFLKFPRKGQRKLKFQLDIIDAKHPPQYEMGYLVEAHEGSVLAFQTLEMDYDNPNLGYEDQSENRDKLHGYAIELGYAMSAVDGDIDADEELVIREWANKHIAVYDVDSDRHKEEKQRFDGIITQAANAAHNHTLKLDDVLDNIKAVADTGDLYDCLELALQVASADGVADDAELQLVDYIANKLDLDRKRLREMQDKILPVTMYSTEVDENSTEALLGITADMDNNTIRRHLLTEYSKWNNMASHKDPERREQAEKMLQLIAETRKKYT